MSTLLPHENPLIMTMIMNIDNLKKMKACIVNTSDNIKPLL